MRYAAALSAPWAVEWLTEASPRLVTTIASSGQRRSRRQVGEVAEREGQADRARQVRGDGRGLREDVQRRVAEDLVPAAGDRVGRGGAQPEQHVADRRRSPRPGARPRCGPRGRRRSRPSGSAAGPGRRPGSAVRARRWPRARPSRSCRSPRPAPAASAPRGRGAGSGAERRRAPARGRRRQSARRRTRAQRADRRDEVLVDRLHHPSPPGTPAGYRRDQPRCPRPQLVIHT